MAAAEAEATVKTPKSPEARKEARSALLQLLLIILCAVAIVYLGFNLGTGVIIFVMWIVGRAIGVA